MLRDAKTIVSWIMLLINNTIVMHNNTAFRQIIGIPIGPNCAVFLANFVFFSYEFQYHLRMLTKRKYKRIDMLRYVNRFLDDIAAMNYPLFEKHKYQIYPKDMFTLNIESSGLPMHCLDIHFYYCQTRQCFATRLHTKEEDPKFKGLPFTKYPSPCSFINQSAMYNTFTTLLHTRFNTHSFFDTFKLDVTTLIKLLTKGYNKNRLRKKFQHFVTVRKPFYRALNVHSVTKHMFKQIDN
jgi:hypothetical protein